ncbi:MAG TPA: hypothetical protein VEO53_04545 [Candidatus Binatia bacterium]|nr:hypothetical protein [Candidatus Binatia bacterium]
MGEREGPKMNLTGALTAAIVAGVVSLVGAVLSYRSSTSSARQQVQQGQLNEIVLKRIKIYPKLWGITIFYETNWAFEENAKTREWAQEYASKLNNFNVEGGLFFSQDLYSAFFALRKELYDAIRETRPGEGITEERTKKIRAVVYGEHGQPGMSTYLKDDLGSYRAAVLQRRSA